MKANFEKSFDNSYSYFREIQILTYLNQRSAPVPVLLEGFCERENNHDGICWGKSL